MDYLNKKYVLNDGNEIPAIGAGFWQVSPSVASEVANLAIKVGYKHIDDAVAYRNEEEVGKGIKQSGTERHEIFITSKIPAEVKNYKDAKNCIDDSLRRLGVDYLDLMLIHAPKPWALMFMPISPNFNKQNIQVYKALEDAQKEGKIRSIGVSNFGIKDLINIKENCSVPVAVNQIRIHAGHVPEKVIEYCKENNIIVEAYSPLGTGHLLKNKKLIEMANKYNVSVAQLCIKFILQLDLVVLPKTTHEEYLIKNSQLDFVIEKSDMELLKKL